MELTTYSPVGNLLLLDLCCDVRCLTNRVFHHISFGSLLDFLRFSVLFMHERNINGVPRASGTRARNVRFSTSLMNFVSILSAARPLAVQIHTCANHAITKSYESCFREKNIWYVQPAATKMNVSECKPINRVRCLC